VRRPRWRAVGEATVIRRGSARRRNPASVPSLQSGTSSGSLTRLASMTVSSTVKPGQASQVTATATGSPGRNGRVVGTTSHAALAKSSQRDNAPSRRSRGQHPFVIPVGRDPGGTGVPEVDTARRTSLPHANELDPAERPRAPDRPESRMIADCSGRTSRRLRSTTANSEKPQITLSQPVQVAPVKPRLGLPAGGATSTLVRQPASPRRI